MKEKLDVDCDRYLSDMTTDQKWTKFAVKLKPIMVECVPKRKAKHILNMGKGTNNNIPMSRKLWRKIKRKQRLCMRLKRLKENTGAGHNRGYKEVDIKYKRLNNQIRWETRNATKLKEQEIAKHVIGNPKSLLELWTIRN